MSSKCSVFFYRSAGVPAQRCNDCPIRETAEKEVDMCLGFTPVVDVVSINGGLGTPPSPLWCLRLHLGVPGMCVG